MVAVLVAVLGAFVRGAALRHRAVRHNCVVAQAPFDWVKPAFAKITQVTGIGDADSKAKDNLDEAKAAYESEFQNDPFSFDTASAGYALQAAFNAFYMDKLRVPPAVVAATTILGGVIAADLGDIF